jgi:alpha-glucosidase
VKDPIGVTGWPKEKGRDGERTPMQWNATENAGFTKGTPWLPVPPSYTTTNVQAEEQKPDSLLNWYKQLIQLKKTNAAFANGDDTMLNEGNEKVLSWVRQAPDGTQVVVACNFTADPQTINLADGTVKGKSAKTLMKSPGGADPGSLENVELGAFGVYVGQVQ